MAENSSAALTATVATGSDTRERTELLNAIALTMVSPGAWQVRDTRERPGVEGHLLGFIQERHGVFELMQLADQFRWSSFVNIKLAIDFVVETNATVVQARHTGDLGWVLSR